MMRSEVRSKRRKKSSDLMSASSRHRRACDRHGVDEVISHERLGLAPSALQQVHKPLGQSASIKDWRSRRDTVRASGAGFHSTAFPYRIAGTILPSAIKRGLSKGVMT